MDESPLSHLGQRWRERSPAHAAHALVEAGYHPVIARILAGRGLIRPEEAASFVDAGFHRLHPPQWLSGMERAVSRIREAIERGEIIGIYGDYDVDGQTSTALLVRVLSKLGARLRTHIPHRTKEGYGLNLAALQRLRDEGCTLVVTVDCGITGVPEAAWAKQNGLDLIVTDHHQPQDELPGALAVINPHLDAGYPCPHLAGCGVAFKLAEAVAEEMRGDRSLAHAYVELVALGTVADVVPLLDENRALVKEGLARINGKGAIPGIQALRAVAGVHGEVTAGHIAYVLGPRLNAVGRVADASLGLKLLLAPSYDQALPYARKLEEENATRRRLEERVTEEAHEVVHRVCDPVADHGLVVDGAHWHPGVIGIVASRLAEAYYRPTVVLSVSGDEARGSARSIPGFDLYSALAECADLFTAFGGHHAAAGMSLPASKIGEFRDRFRAVTRERLPREELIPVLTYDCEVELSAIDLDLIEAIGRLEPYGVGNPAPVVICRDVQAEASAVGKDKTHLKLSLVDERRRRRLDAIGFGLAPKVLARLSGRALVDIAFTPAVGEWNGERRPELRIKDVREAATLSSPAARELAAYRELAAAGEVTTAIPVHVRRATAGRQDTVSLAAVQKTLGSIEVVDARHACRAALIDELLASGRSALVVAAAPRLALELAHDLASASPRARERTLLLAGSMPESLLDLALRALSKPPWIAVIGDLAPAGDGEGAALPETVAGLLAASSPVILLCQVPAAPRTGLVQLCQVASLAPRAPLYLALDRREAPGIAARLRAIYPDRDALSRVYLALKEAVGESRGSVSKPALAAKVAARWPQWALGDAVDEALSILIEVGLVDALPGGYTLVPAGGKVDLAQSLRYNESIAIRDHYQGFVETLDSLAPREVVSCLIERGAPWWP